MANLLAAAVLENGFWYQFGGEGAKRRVVDVTLTLTGQGSETNLIACTLFSMVRIDQVLSMRNAAGYIYNASPDLNGLNVIINQPPGIAVFEGAGANSSGGPANITVAGMKTTSTILEVEDVTDGSELSLANFTPGAGIVVQAQAAGDLSSKTLRIVYQQAQGPTDITDTVRCLIIGPEY